MKKYLFIFGLLACSAQISAMERTEKRVKQNPVEDEQFSAQELLFVGIKMGLHEAIPCLMNDKTINKKDEQGNTPLMYAVKCNRPIIARIFLDTKGCDVDAQDSEGDTPLMHAVHAGNPEMVKLLLKYQANANAQDVHGNTPLHVLVASGKINLDTQDILFHLLKHGADICIKNNEDPGNKQCATYGQTPLHYAINYKRLSAVLTMISFAQLHTIDDELSVGKKNTYAKIIGIMANLYNNGEKEQQRFINMLINLTFNVLKDRLNLFERLYDIPDMNNTTVRSLIYQTNDQGMYDLLDSVQMMKMFIPQMNERLLIYFKERNSQ